MLLTDNILISERLPPVSGVAKPREKKYEDKTNFGGKRSSRGLSQQTVLLNNPNYISPPPHSWVIPPSDAPLTRCTDSPVRRELTVYLPCMYLVPRVIALPGQHFSHFTSKSGMTNQCVIHVFLSSRYAVQSIPIPNGYDKGRCFHSELGPSPAWRHTNGSTALIGHIESNITPSGYAQRHLSSWKCCKPRKERVQKPILLHTIFPPSLFPALRNISQKSGCKLTFFKVDSIIEY